MKTDLAVDLEIGGPAGPRIVYPAGTSRAQVDALAPEGWEADWDAPSVDREHPMLRARPLHRVTSPGQRGA